MVPLAPQKKKDLTTLPTFINSALSAMPGKMLNAFTDVYFKDARRRIAFGSSFILREISSKGVKTVTMIAPYRHRLIRRGMNVSTQAFSYQNGQKKNIRGKCERGWGLQLTPPFPPIKPETTNIFDKKCSGQNLQFT